MSHRGGLSKTRAGKASATAITESGSVVAAAPASTGAAPPGVSRIADPGAEATAEFLFVRAISQASGGGSAPLSAIQRLLKSVVAAAGSVVRGTDSQRRFTSLYTEFCMSAVRSLADVEDAVYELTHPGCRAADAVDSDVHGINDADFLKQVAAYVATHTTTLSVAYLEHVGLSALEKLQKQQRKRERPAAVGGTSGSSSASAPSGLRAAKVSRTATATAASAKAAYSAGSTIADTLGGASLDTLGLMDSQETMRHALRAIEREKQASGMSTAATASASGAPASRRGVQASATALLRPTHGEARPSGVFLSKASAGSTGTGSSATASAADGTSLGNGTVAYDLCNPHLRLSSIPELSTWLQPWTLPVLLSGVYLDRVTAERERRGGHPPSSTATATTNNGPSSTATATTAAAEAAKPVLEVCLAPTPMEMLRLWEARESALVPEPRQQPSASGAALAAAGPFSVVPYAGSSGRAGGPSAGGSPRPTATMPTSPLAHQPMHLPESATRLADAAAMVTTSSAFFPAVRDRRTATNVPTYVMANLSHYGASRIEHVYAMGPMGK
ncbi:hypothetical protein NESM_000092600 [Novymonas esmeraldas]|uniref:Uncharacterized protein n=1 Tax=Novymonas esmeraldas TaxID=1808958 RepID=A0AAW0F2M7_9TRYP